MSDKTSQETSGAGTDPTTPDAKVPANTPAKKTAAAKKPAARKAATSKPDAKKAAASKTAAAKTPKASTAKAAAAKAPSAAGKPASSSTASAAPKADASESASPKAKTDEAQKQNSGTTASSDTPASNRDWMKYFVRGVTMFVYGIFGVISLHILFMLAFINTLVWVVTDSPNKDLSRWIKSIGLYLGEIAIFLSLKEIDDEYPFPISHRPFPQDGDD